MLNINRIKIRFLRNKPSSLPADVLWGLLLFVTHSILRGEKWMRDEQKQTLQLSDSCWFARDVTIAMLMVKNQGIFLHWELKSNFLQILRKNLIVFTTMATLLTRMPIKSIHRFQNCIVIKF